MIALTIHHSTPHTHPMKPISRTIATVILSLVIVTASAFDWQAKTNEELYNDMVEYASTFATESTNARMRRVLKRFIRVEQKKYPQDPYAWIHDSYQVANKLEAHCGPVIDDDTPTRYTTTSHAFSWTTERASF